MKGSKDGDLFISASAGTGKTFTISKRYIEIFERAFESGEDINVGNVAAITFTRKAAGEMKERIVEMIRERAGKDPRWTNLLYSMPFAWIGTIDSFAGRILSEIGPFAGVDPGFGMASGSGSRPLLKRAALRTIWDSEDLVEPLLRVVRLDQLVEALTHGMEQERAKILASRPVDVVEGELSLHHDSEMAGDLAEANRAFLALFRRVHEAYLRDMDRENLTDFAGVLLTLREVLRSRPTLRSRLQDQFRFVIVDEFQDTDFLQKEIIDLLRGPETNVVYVGDAKQSIYRFRGAEVEVFSEARWEVESRSGMVQELDTNYRSHPGVLSFCNRFFPGIFDGDEEGGDRPSAQGYEQVEPLPVEGETGDLPRAKILFHPEDEAKAAALFIKRMAGREFDFLERKADGEGKVLLVASRRRIRYRDFAILLRKLRGGAGDRYAKALRELEIPHYVVGESGFFELPEISGLVSMLKVLADPEDDLAMATALLSPVVGFDLQDLAQLKYRARFGPDGETCRSLGHGHGRNHSHSISLFDALNMLEEGDLSSEKTKRIALFKEVLDRFGDQKDVLKPSEILEAAVEILDYEAYLALSDPLKKKTANLRKLIEASRTLDEAGLSLREVISRLEAFGFDDVEPASVESEETDAVKVMTVHKAKGLEFPIVIVGDTSWSDPPGSPPFLFRRSGEERRDLAFTLLPREKAEEGTILFELTEEEKEREIEEEKRTLYVAATRAADLLAITVSSPKRRRARPWRNMLSSLIIPGENQNDAPEVDPAFKDIVEVIYASDLEVTATACQAQEEREPVIPDLRFIGPVETESESFRISPTRLTEPWEHNGSGQVLEQQIEAGQIIEDGEESLEPKDLGRLAHQILENLGVGGRTLASLGSVEKPGRPAHLYAGRFGDDELREVWKFLDQLMDHDQVREIEGAENLRTEFEIIRPFGRYILAGRVDKLVKTKGGWRIVDFKFADSVAHSPAYEFQMKFYLYLARDLFRPMLDAKLFYLKDGGVREVGLGDEDVPEFEEELRGRIERGWGKRLKDDLQASRGQRTEP